MAMDIATPANNTAGTAMGAAGGSSSPTPPTVVNPNNLMMMMMMQQQQSNSPAGIPSSSSVASVSAASTSASSTGCVGGMDNISVSDTKSIDSWAGGTVATQATLALVPHADGVGFCCPKHPAAILHDRNVLCQDCEAEFQSRRIELRQRQATVQQRLQELSVNAGDILQDLHSSMKQWKTPDGGSGAFDPQMQQQQQLMTGNSGTMRHSQPQQQQQQSFPGTIAMAPPSIPEMSGISSSGAVEVQHGSGLSSALPNLTARPAPRPDQQQALQGASGLGCHNGNSVHSVNLHSVASGGSAATPVRATTAAPPPAQQQQQQPSPYQLSVQQQLAGGPAPSVNSPTPKRSNNSSPAAGMTASGSPSQSHQQHQQQQQQQQMLMQQQQQQTLMQQQLQQQSAQTQFQQANNNLGAFRRALPPFAGTASAPNPAFSATPPFPAPSGPPFPGATSAPSPSGFPGAAPAPTPPGVPAYMAAMLNGGMMPSSVSNSAPPSFPNSQSEKAAGSMPPPSLFPGMQHSASMASMMMTMHGMDNSGGAAAAGFHNHPQQMIMQRMQAMQDWMLWQKEQELQSLRKQAQDQEAQMNQLRVDNALLKEKLQQQEERMQQELSVIKSMAAMQQQQHQEQLKQQQQRQQEKQRHHQQQRHHRHKPSLNKSTLGRSTSDTTQATSNMSTNDNFSISSTSRAYEQLAPIPDDVYDTWASPQRPPQEHQHHPPTAGDHRRQSSSDRAPATAIDVIAASAARQNNPSFHEDIDETERTGNLEQERDQLIELGHAMAMNDNSNNTRHSTESSVPTETTTNLSSKPATARYPHPTPQAGNAPWPSGEDPNGRIQQAASWEVVPAMTDSTNNTGASCDSNDDTIADQYYKHKQKTGGSSPQHASLPPAPSTTPTNRGGSNHSEEAKREIEPEEPQPPPKTKRYAGVANNNGGGRHHHPWHNDMQKKPFLGLPPSSSAEETAGENGTVDNVHSGFSSNKRQDEPRESTQDDEEARMRALFERFQQEAASSTVPTDINVDDLHMVPLKEDITFGTHMPQSSALQQQQIREAAAGVKPPPLRNVEPPSMSTPPVASAAAASRSNLRTAATKTDLASRASSGVSFADDAISVGQTVASSTFGEDLVKVTKQRIKDPYGDQGEYTGVILRSTGMPHGAGRMRYQEDSRTYEGEWRHGRWHGHGNACFANGDTYIGHYKFDQRDGRGTYTWSDGRIYDGMFQEDKRHGHGKFTWPDGAVYCGDFVNGQRQGQGSYTFSDGGRYEGSWVDGRYSGFGICTWEDGRCYKGEWMNGMAHGKGIETFADGTIRHDGFWEQDEPIFR